MDLLKKHKVEFILSFCIIALYFCVRTLFLLHLPLFIDEANYIWWAQIALADSSQWMISLSDGKQPMYVWFLEIFLKFISDPLLAGRLTSVFCGFFTLIGITRATHELFKNKYITVIASFTYIAFPFSQVYDRMAITDSAVSLFCIWSLYFSLKLIRQPRFMYAVLLGLSLGFGMLTKSSAFLYLFLSPLSFIVFNFYKKDSLQNFKKAAIYIFLSVIISFVAYSIIYLSPSHGNVTSKNMIFVYSIGEWFMLSFNFIVQNFFSNLFTLLLWLIEYLNISYALFLVIGLLNKEYKKQNIMLLLYCFIPLLLLSLFGKLLFPRYIYFMSLYLIPIISLGIYTVVEYISNTFKLNIQLKIIVILLCLSMSLFLSLLYAINPKASFIADKDYEHYVINSLVGEGTKESLEFFKQQAKDKKIFIASNGVFGTIPQGLIIYLKDNKNITINGYVMPNDVLPQEVLDQRYKTPTYLLVNSHIDEEMLKKETKYKIVFEKTEENNPNIYKVYQLLP